MLSLTPKYARLTIEKLQAFGDVTESLRSLFQICRLNDFKAALVVSYQDAYDFRSSVRVALRFAASRSAIPPIKLALVVSGADFGVRGDVQDVAEELGLECKFFFVEEHAISWILPAAIKRM
jgi:hypothetical protein